MQEQIYFKNTEGELRGPYPERQVQEWYRQDLFKKGAVPYLFTFVVEGESPTDSVRFFTLDELQTRNGASCPFRISEMLAKEEREAITQRLEGMNKSIADIRKVAQTFESFEERLEKLDAQLEKLCPPTTVPATEQVSTAPEPQLTRKKECEKWISEIAEFIALWLESLRTNNIDKLWARFPKARDLLNTATKRLVVTEDQDARAAFKIELEKRLEQVDLFSCSICGYYTFKWRQALIHLIDMDHANAMKRLYPKDGVSPDVASLIFDWAVEHLNKEKKEELAQSVKLTESDKMPTEVRPSKAFKETLMGKYQYAVFMGESENNQVHDAVARNLKAMNKSLLLSFIHELKSHIGTGIVYCSECVNLYTDVRAYFQHLSRYSHLAKVAKLDNIDLITIVVNYANTTIDLASI